MHKTLRHRLRDLVPFALRLRLARLRDLRGPEELLGRWQAGGRQAAISPQATARRWRHVRIGAGSIVERGVHFHSNDDGEGVRIAVGERCFVGQNSFFSAGDGIVVERDCTIGANCNLLAAGHRYDRPTVAYGSAEVISYGTMRLGPNVWIGVGATLVGDVQVGFGSLVAAGSVLREALPPLCLAAGNPARIVKIFDWPDQVWRRVPVEPTGLCAYLVRHRASLPTEAYYLEQLKTMPAAGSAHVP